MEDNKIKEILKNIEDAFINEENYELRKNVEEFTDEQGKFLGDFVSFLMIDKNTTPPIFFSVVSPFDLISKKDPQQALIWQDGEMLLNTNYTDYAAMRTGAMDSIALKLCSIESLAQKKILIFGTGSTTKWSIKVLKTVFNDFISVNYINSTNSESSEFESFCKDLGINAEIGNKESINDYDIILCHTNAKESILKKEDIQNLKQDAIITTYIGSTEHGEVDDEFYNENSNIVLDWDQNLKVAKDILRSNIPENDLIMLKDLLSNSNSLSKDKKYTIFRFLGTPMQNLGVLKSLI